MKAILAMDDKKDDLARERLLARLFERLKWIEGRLLYVRRYAARAEGRLFPPEFSSEARFYMELRRVIRTPDAIHLMRAGDPEPIDICAGGVATFLWFDPDPLDIQWSDSVWDLVLNRRMRPMQILWMDAGWAYWMEMFLAPPWIRQRPRGPLAGDCLADWGEPWCKLCEPTFYWTPGATSNRYIVSGSHVRCARCFRVMG